MSEPKEYDDRCPACGLSSSAWEESCDDLFRRYEAITREAVLAERERVIGLIEGECTYLGVELSADLRRLVARVRGAK